MTDIPPTYRRRAPPSRTEVWEAQKREILKKINCVRVGTIKSFDAGEEGLRSPTVNIIIAQQQVTSTTADGSQTLAEYPELREVPVIFPCGGGFTLTFPIAAGDECLVLFNDRELDNWLLNGAGLPPSTGRLHDLADAVALVGLRSNPRALADISTSSVQLRSDDGENFVEVNSSGIKVHAGTVYAWDCHGYGEKWTWTGGVNWTHDTYFTGANVTTNAHNINPPVIP